MKHCSVNDQDLATVDTGTVSSNSGNKGKSPKRPGTDISGLASTLRKSTKMGAYTVNDISARDTRYHKRDIRPRLKEIGTALSQSGYCGIYEQYFKYSHRASILIYQRLQSYDHYSHQLYKWFANFFENTPTPLMDSGKFNVKTLEEYLRDNSIIYQGRHRKLYSDQQSPANPVFPENIRQWSYILK